MGKKLAALSIFSLVLRTIAQGLLPILPVIVQNTGANKSKNGIFMSIVYSMLLLGSLITGKKLSTKVSSPGFLILSVLLTAILIFLFGMQHSFYGLLTITSLLWFVAGINVTSVNILTGAYGDTEKSGRYFGILAVISLLGTIVGGFVVGPSIEKFGYFQSFSVFALLFIASSVPLIIISFKEQKLQAKRIDVNAQNVIDGFSFLKDFKYLLAGTLIVATMIYFFKLSLSLYMKSLNFSLTEISIGVSLGAIIACPFPWIFGVMTEKHSKRRLLLICYLSGVVAFALGFFSSIFLLAVAAVSFISVFSFCNKSVSSAIIMEIYSSGDYKKALSYYDVAAWGGGIIGYVLSGFLLEGIGFKGTFIAGVLISSASLLIIRKIKLNKATTLGTIQPN